MTKYFGVYQELLPRYRNSTIDNKKPTAAHIKPIQSCFLYNHAIIVKAHILTNNNTMILPFMISYF